MFQIVVALTIAMGDLDDNLMMDASELGPTPLTTWHTSSRPTKTRPLRKVDCLGCGQTCLDRDYFFPQEYRRWAYYISMPKLSEVKQPHGSWCFECDTQCDTLTETKVEIAGLLRQKEYSETWNAVWLPKTRERIATQIEKGLDRLPKQSKRKISLEHASESRIFVPGTWLVESKYKQRFPDPADRKHKAKRILNPETGVLCKAFFVPDSESGVWRGEHGYGDYTNDTHDLNEGSDDEKLDEAFAKYTDRPQVLGKPLSQFEAEAVDEAR